MIICVARNNKHSFSTLTASTCNSDWHSIKVITSGWKRLDYSLRDLLCPLDSSVGMWNLAFTFDQSSMDSSGIILSGTYL